LQSARKISGQLGGVRGAQLDRGEEPTVDREGPTTDEMNTSEP